MKPIIAIMYDFDKTLSTTDMQNYTFIPKLGLTPDEFWKLTGDFAASQGVERILSYMYVMVDQCKKKGIKLTKEYLAECGKDIVLNPGVDTWFDRINDFGNKHGVEVQHYLVSSGTLEIVKGNPIINKFNEAYGCEFYFNDEGEAVWPKTAINYTQKTQFFFRISKGATNIQDDMGVNIKLIDKKIPYNHIYYVGDGMTDVACMSLVTSKGGHSIAVYPSNGSKDVAYQIKKDDRCEYAIEADYSEGSMMEKFMQNEILSIERKNQFDELVKDVEENK